MIDIDGSEGEGGGQVLRTSLSLSMVTGVPVTLTHIRAGREKAGLLRQHLTCVNAAAEMCGGTVEGAELRSTRVVFRPGRVRPGTYHFQVGTAGSASLVLQTVLPALLLADSPSTIRIEGGTHNMAAPPFAFLERAFAPHVGLSLELERWGFYPAGGGALKALVTPRCAPIAILERGPLTLSAHAAIAGRSAGVAHAALGILRAALGLAGEHVHLHTVSNSAGPGFVVWIEARHAGGTEVCTAFGERRESPDIARRAIAEFEAWQATGAPVGEHLADQLLIPLALFGGAFRTGPQSLHTRTNASIIERFLPVRFQVVDGVWRAIGR